ncbi:MAG: hypothetical protein JSR44_00170 [Spirochaetes bacterium]|nr:hypothetical protein [Spirochaetota bacterium]
MRTLFYSALLTVMAMLAMACGRVSGNGSQSQAANVSGVVSPNDPAASPTGAPPAYVSSATVSSTQFTVTLTKECTDATGLNPANFILSNGLQVTSITKQIGDANTLVVNTTIQQPISYTLTMLNLVGTNAAPLVGVIQVNFTGLPSPALTSVDWRNPADGSVLPIAAGAIALCKPGAAAGTTCTSAPFYNKNTMYGILTGAYAVAYKFKIDAGSWSSEIPLATPLNTGALSDGYHTIYIIGKHTNGYWQDTTASDVFSVSWMQDTTPPTALLNTVTLPSAVTASLNLNVGVVGTDVSYFKYCLDNGTINDCSTATYQGAPDLASGGLAIPNAVYTGSLVPGSVTVKVIGYDASGNALAAPVAGGSYTYTIDTGVVEAVYLLSDLTSITPTQTSVAIHVLGSNGAAAYKGKVVDGTDCNQGTTWDLLPIQPLATPITASGLTDAVPQKTVCAIGESVSGLYWQGGWSGTTTASIITKYTWTVDTTPPIAIINWINPVTQPTITTLTTGYQMQISSTGAAVNYRYALVTGAGAPCSSASYNASTSVNNPIVLNPPAIATTGVTVYKVCVIGQDAAGNWQSTATATATPEWTVDVDPPANNPSFTAASSSPAKFPIGVLVFNIDNTTATTDSQNYRIQVAQDAGFTQIISDTIVPSCKNVSLPDCPVALTTKQFSVAVDPFATPSAYARVQAGDPYGNYRSDFSATSAEHYVVGKVGGTIKDQNNTTVSGISIQLYTTGGTNVTALYGGPFTTDVNGVFTIDNVRTAKLGYQIRAAVGDPNYFPATKRGVTVQGKGSLGTIVTNIGTLNLATIAGSSAQTITAKVVDGDDGWMLGYPNASLIDYQGSVVATQRGTYSGCASIPPVGSPPTNIPRDVFTDPDTTVCGDLSFAAVPPGTYTIQVDGASWGVSNQLYNQLNIENVTVYNAAVSKGRIPLVRLLAGQDLKVVLAWGTLYPLDFDLHVVGTLPAGQTLTNVGSDTCNNTQFHSWGGRPNIGYGVWQEQYSSKTRTYVQGNGAYSGNNYFPLDPTTTTALVQDANNGYGPEVQNFIGGYTDGTYWVTVVNWSEWLYNYYSGTPTPSAANQAWDQTNVQVKVYDADGVAFEMIATQPAVAPTNPNGADPYCNAVSNWGHCELWNAFKITISGGGSAGRVYTPVNTYQGWPGDETTAPARTFYSFGTNSWDINKCLLSSF